MDFSYEQRQLLLGSLLGDGGLYIHKNGKNAYFQERHGGKQSEYLMYKYEILKEYCASAPKEGSSYNKKYDKWHKTIMLRTRCLPAFTQLHDLWYKEGKKIVPQQEVNEIDPLGLAVWFGDDGGSTQSSRRELATHSFTEEEQLLLQDLFVEKFAIKPEICRNQNCVPYLVFSKTSMRKFIGIIKPHLHATMIYKILHVSVRQRKFTKSQAEDIRGKYRTGCHTQRALAKEYNVSCSVIWRTIHGKYSSRDEYEWN